MFDRAIPTPPSDLLPPDLARVPHHRSGLFIGRSAAGVLAAVLAFALACDQPPPPTRTIDAEVERRALEALASLPGGPEPASLAEELNRLSTPGAAVVLIDGGEILWSKRYGVAEAGGEEPIEATTRFHVGRLAEPVLGTLRARFAADGATGSLPEGADALGAILRREVFAPLGMNAEWRETAGMKPSSPERVEEQGNGGATRALGHDVGGRPLVAGTAESGLWASADALALWLTDLQKAHAGKPARRLDRTTARQLFALEREAESERQLGLSIEGDGQARWFHAHGGDAARDAGFTARLVGFVFSGHGAVVLLNRRDSDALADRIVAALAHAYDWPAARGSFAAVDSAPATTEDRPTVDPATSLNGTS
ncbi:MAG: hypothetical protein AAGN46_11630 [Acidobacteriota bacterium]